jgi:NAD(P)-dependent dehydrogenase (short-subunit alcohol dehydrogenase family)
MTRQLACEWAQHGVRVNAVAPGYISTPGVLALEAEGKRSLRGVRRRIPLGRLGRPEEIADAIAFLASTRAGYMTGTVVPVDGGWSAFGDAGDAADVD